MNRQITMATLLLQLVTQIVHLPAGELTRVEPILLPELLLLIGDRHDVYFTIEAYSPEIRTPLAIAGYDTERLGVEDEAETLNRLQLALPGFVLTRELINSRIIHIRDKRLPVDPMSEFVRDFSYTGSPCGLVRELGRMGLGVGSPRSGWISGGRVVQDSRECVAIVGRTTSVRTLLSSAFDLGGYNRLIWTAGLAEERNIFELDWGLVRVAGDGILAPKE